MDWNGHQVVVFGGAGFIGSHLVEGLIGQGLRVSVVDPCLEGTSGSSDNLAQVEDRIEWIHQDVEQLNPSQWRSLLGDASLVIDAMGMTRHHVGVEFPERDLQLNYISHLAVIQALKEHPVPVLYLGSRGQYGKMCGRMDESSPMVPLDPQGVHKTAAEAMYRIYSGLYRFDCLSLRLGNCFGPRQPYTGGDLGLVGGLIEKLMAQEEALIFGDETRSRHLIYVEDVVRAIFRLMQHPFTGFEAVNLVGEAVRLDDLMKALIAQLGGTYSFAPFPPGIARLECGEAEISQDRFLTLAGDSFSFSNLRDAIRETCAYFKGVLP